MSTEENNGILDGYVTREELASSLRKHVRTIDRWDQERIGPPKTMMGKTILYRVSSVRDWLASREQKQARATRG